MGNLNARSKHYEACYECANRREGCHSDCEEYAKEVILGAILDAEDKKISAMRKDEYAVREQKAMRIANSCPAANKVMRKSGYIRNRGR